MEPVEDGDLASAGSDALLPVPSGLAVSLQDVIWNVPGAQGLTLRFRFVAPELASVDVEAALGDMQALCESYALKRVTDFGPVPQQIIVSLADAPRPFGEVAPDAVQYFEAFRIEGDACIWEIY